MRVGSLGVKQKSIILALNLAQPEIESDIIEKVYFESNVSAHPASFDYTKTPNVKKIMFIKGKEGLLTGRSSYYPYKIYKRDYSHIENYYNNGFWKIPANVSYFYNYDNAVNDGYYWIDDYDYGDKIEYIPKDPVRDGYVFSGWYKETECINRWNF